MKKNYLSMAILSILVLSGCDNDSSSSKNPSNSSSTTPSYVPVSNVKDAVSEVATNYTIIYKLGGQGTSYSVKYEDEFFYSDYTNEGYYFMNETLFYLQLDTNGAPFYSSNGDVEAYYEDTTIDETFRKSMDLNNAFKKAEWSFVSLNEDEEEESFATTDADVIEVANFLTNKNHDGKIKTVNARVSIEDPDMVVISGFDTYDASGKLLASADVKRIGFTKAFGSNGTPKLFDGLEPALVNRWLNYHDLDSLLGGQMDDFEITNDGNLTSYQYDKTTGQLVKTVEFEFLAPTGFGGYIFTNAADDIVIAYLTYGPDLADGTDYGDVYFETLPNGGTEEDIGFNYAVSYYSVLLDIAASQYAGCYMEPVLSDDEEYEAFVSELTGAVAAYRIYDGSTLENSTTYIIVTQFATMEAAAKLMMEGDKELYNGYIIGGYAWGYFVPTGYETESDLVTCFAEVVRYLPQVYITPDYDVYGTPAEGQSELDYLIAYMASRGFAYVTKDTAEEGTEYANTITELLATFDEIEAESKEKFAADPETPIAPHCEDVYLFYADLDVGSGQVIRMYVAVAVFAEPADENTYAANYYYTNSFGNLVLANGYLMPMGTVINALLSYEYFQSLAQA